jgi:hypothetical protein
MNFIVHFAEIVNGELANILTAQKHKEKPRYSVIEHEGQIEPDAVF